MRRWLALSHSLVGQKVIMAVTGLILFLFVVAHLIGNLKVYEGPERFNAYARWLREAGEPLMLPSEALWIARSVLLVALVLHLWSATRVTLASWRARPVAYHRLELVETTYAARTMRWGGVLIAVYVVYHLLDFTFGPANPSFDPENVYHNVVASFLRWPVSAFYAVAVIAVGLHIYHGLWSAFQTLGANRPPSRGWRRGVAGGIALVITAGYVSIPVSVLAGVLR